MLGAVLLVLVQAAVVEDDVKRVLEAEKGKGPARVVMKLRDAHPGGA